ncbi:MAG: hypothetical protein NT166_00090 [Candidatus Aminicenantes bacterium]|nr:hypothetical protein [Candidatus Aminicenantes bacterium]
MKKIVLTVLVLLMVVGLFPEDTILLKKSESIDLLEKMEANDFFMKAIFDVDVDENCIYFLDHDLGSVFRVDKNTAKLVNNIGSKGQGPSELQYGVSLRVINKMVFVSDIGFNGIKIFTIDGKIVKEFKTISLPTWLDVNQRNEIFVSGVSSEGYPNISIYNMEGKKIREFLKFPCKETWGTSYLLNSKVIFRMDNEENLVVVFILKKLVRKYSKIGALLWEREIKNKIMDKYNTDAQFDVRKTGAIHFKEHVFSLDIDGLGNIIVGHIYGGVIYDKNGDIIHLIQFEPPNNLGTFRIYDGKILAISGFCREINVYKCNLKQEVKR